MRRDFIRFMPSNQMGATMTNKLVRASAALALAAGLALAVPTAANAYTDPVVAETTGSAGPNGTLGVSIPAGTMAANEAVGLSVTGESALGITTAIVKTAVETNSSLRTQADASGAVAVNLKFPATASGAYSITLVGLESGRSVSLVAGDATGAGTGTGTGGSGSNASGLPATGLDSGSLLGLWVGGGALVLAGGAIAVGTTVRRARNAAA